MLCAAALAPTLPLIAFFKVLVSMGFFEDGYRRATLLSHAPSSPACTTCPTLHAPTTTRLCQAAHCRVQRHNPRLLPFCPDPVPSSLLTPFHLSTHPPSITKHSSRSQPHIWSPGAEMDKAVVAKAKEQFSALDKVSSSSS